MGVDVRDGVPACNLTFKRSSGLPIRIPAAPLMYPAQKSADIFFFGFEKIASLPQDHGTELKTRRLSIFLPKLQNHNPS